MKISQSDKANDLNENFKTRGIKETKTFQKIMQKQITKHKGKGIIIAFGIFIGQTGH